MDSLITFCNEISCLTDAEYQQCITSINRNILTSIIFSGLYSQISDNKIHNVQQINKIITQIKDTPEKIDNETDQDVYLPLTNNNNQTDSIQLDNIPSALLSEISSFLVFDDKVRFEQTNRLIFIGVRYYKVPLYHLTERNFIKLIEHCNELNDKYISPIFMSIFKTVKIDALEITDGSQWSADGDQLYNLMYELNHLALFNNIKTLEIKIEDISQLKCIWSHLFKRTNLRNLNTIKIIATDDWTIDDKDPFGLCELGNHPSLKYVEIFSNEVYIDSMDNHHYKFISSLNGFAIRTKNVASKSSEGILYSVENGKETTRRPKLVLKRQ
eukprot:78939_1